MTTRVKKLLIIILIIVVVAGVGTGVYFLFFHKTDPSLRVRKLVGEQEGIVVYGVSNYKNSALNLYPYGTFDIALIRTIGGEDTLIFSGIGTWTKDKNSYTFTYIEYYALDNSVIKDNTATYTIESGRVGVEYGIVFYFG
jgi:flagellar basal body-associated protein FliL